MPAPSYYDPGQGRATKVESLFNHIAPRYDFINDAQSFGLHRLWKRKLLNLAEVRPGTKALDVCCGSGDVTFSLQALGAESAGCDFSLPMLQVAARRNREGKVAFLRGDALNLPFSNQTFDLVTISYGLRNLADFERGLSEMLRVLKPGGRLLILDFGKPPARFVRALYFAYLRYLVPVFGRLFCGNPAAYNYILESLENYPAQEGIRRLLENLGAETVELWDLCLGVMSIHRAVKPSPSRTEPEIKTTFQRS